MRHGYLIDMDGVIYRGSEVIPGAPNLLLICRMQIFLTFS